MDNAYRQQKRAEATEEHAKARTRWEAAIAKPRRSATEVRDADEDMQFWSSRKAFLSAA